MARWTRGKPPKETRIIRAVAHLLDRLSRGLDRLALWGAVLAVLVMLGAAGWQVVARYILAQPPVWTEELARFSMVWAGLLGASCAFRGRTDPTLFPEARNKTGRLGALFAAVRALGVLAFITPILWYSVFGANHNPARGYIARLMGRQAETMDAPMVVFGIAIPIAFTLIFIHLMAELAMQLVDDRTDDRSGDTPQEVL